LIIGAIALSASENPIGGLLALALGPLAYFVVRVISRPKTPVGAIEPAS